MVYLPADSQPSNVSNNVSAIAAAAIKMDDVDEVWKKASERFPTSTTAWLRNFAGDLNRAKRAITDALKGSDSGTNNILRQKLDKDNTGTTATSSGSGEGDCDEAVALLKMITEQPQMTTLIAAYLSDRHNSASHPSSRRENHVLHVAAKNGCVGELRRVIRREHVDVLNKDEETPLHLAAEFEHVDDVRILLKLGATLTADKHGCTPLHSAALAITPNATIARLLVRSAAERGDNFRLLNERSCPESGRNTALHVAAGNVNVTADFILELEDTDPRLQNSELDTAFHVAAKSSNPSVIVHMLSTFKPTNAGWDIDSVDENRGEKAPTLLNICAGNGNAEAVALLIQHGADVSLGVLHEIVIASVKKPEMMDKFLAVYQTVVDNVVTWRCLRDNRKCLIRGSADYNEILRETMIHLTTKPFGDGKNMIQRVIDLGAAQMLSAILNTDNVYKFDEFGVRRNDRLRVMCSFTRFDVTDFARPSTRPAEENESETTVENPAENSERRGTEQDFEKPHRPKMPYLEELLLHRDEWKNKNVLATQPLRKLTKPYFAFVQRYYLILGFIQLIFMIFFSVFYIPDTCTLAHMFSPASSRCYVSPLDAPNGSNLTLLASAQDRESPSFAWLIWPIVMLIGGTTEFFIRFLWNTGVHLARYARNSFTHDSLGLRVLRRLNITVWPTKMLLAAGHSLPLIGFCFSVFVWFHRHGHSADRQLYLEALSMVFLFGWMSNFVLFSGITEHLYVFLIVLNEIVVQDILLSFILVFVYTVVGFSFSLHALRMKIETSKDVLVRTTVYDVFISALGIGSFFEETRDELHERMGLFRVVFAFYICFTAIILLNVLIAMMNNRYEDARRRAEGVWRFEVIKTALILEDFNVFVRYLPITRRINLLCCFFKDLYNDVKKSGRTFVDVRLKVENDG